MSGVPGYWMNETSGVLRPAIEAYLLEKDMTAQQIAAMGAYIRQWMEGAFIGPGIEELRARIGGLTSRDAIESWLDDALELSIDPV